MYNFKHFSEIYWLLHHVYIMLQKIIIKVLSDYKHIFIL
jgi:hypothetical protein